MVPSVRVLEDVGRASLALNVTLRDQFDECCPGS